MNIKNKGIVLNIGDKYGEWEITKVISEGSYECKCSCGTVRIIKRSALINGKSKSCGHKSHVIDLTNQKFGDVIALNYIGDKKWECKCSCGKLVEISSYNLLNGFNTSCNHDVLKGKTEDLRNRQFGYLEPVEYLGNSLWKCKCNCGSLDCLQYKNISRYSLISGNTKSCGANTTGFKDLTNKRFGAWTVLKYESNKKWLCKCECGIESILDLNNLKRCSDYCTHKDKLINIVNKRFGKLVVIKYIGNGLWECKCDCGNIVNVLGSNLRREFRATRSCGCSRDELRVNTMLNKYNELSISKLNNPRESWQIEFLKDRTGLINGIDELTKTLNRKPRLLDLSNYLDCDSTRLADKLDKYNIRDLLDNSSGKSREELKLRDFILGICSDLNYTVESNTRKVIAKIEYDIYIPEIKLAIEYNGSYWHSEIYKSKYYHLNKTIESLRKGIRLIHIFDYEIYDINNRELIYNFLKDVIGYNINIVYARNCEVKEVETSEAKEFLNNNHIQGYVQSKINIGLYYKNELIEIMTFGNPRFNKNYEYELIRLCSKFGYRVVGGSSKLFKYFINTYNPSNIVSYCDISKFKGNVYNTLGFKYDDTSEPNYRWLSLLDNSVISRYRTMKHLLVSKGLGTEEETESEIMRRNNYVKVYDCGNNRYVWSLKE